MTTEEKINNLLHNIISNYAEILGVKSSLITKVLSKLPTENNYIKIDNVNFPHICQTLDNIGNLIQLDEESQICAAIVQSGFANMNPAVVVAMIDNNTLYLASYAKEGLIKQHTAEKALKMIGEILMQN